jgi:hypothetical protein
MFKELKVILSASIQKLKQGIKNAIGVVSGGERKIKQSSNKINQSLNNAFGGDTRTKIDDLNDKINTTKKELIQAEAEVRRYKKDLEGLKEGDKNFEKLNDSLSKNQNKVKVATASLKSYNTELRQNKTNLANSRLAAEDNQSALESMSRTLTAVSSAVLLMDDSSESLRNTMKTLNFAFAAANAVVSINNLKLRENQLFLKASAAASSLFSKATKTAAGSVSILKSSLSALGVGALVTGLGYLINGYLESSSAAQKLADEQKELRDVQKEAVSNYSKEVNEITSLKSIIDDNNKSLTEKKSAYRDLQKLVPSLTNLTLSQAKSTSELTNQTYLQIEAIKARTKAEAFSAILSKKQAELFDLQNAPLEESLTFFDKAQNFLLASSKLSLAANGNLQDNLNKSKAKTRVEEKTLQLQNLITKLTKDYEKSLESSLKFEGKIFKFSQGTAKSKEKQSKIAKQPVNEISKSLIAEERLRAEQEKKFLNTEEEKVRAAIASEERILAIKRSSILQAATAQNLSSAQVIEALRNVTLQEIKLQNEKSDRIQAGINKDTEAELSSIKLTYDQRKDALEGMLRLQELNKQKELDNLNKSIEEGTTKQEDYTEKLKQIQLNYLNARLQALTQYANQDANTEKQIADTKAKIQKLSGEDTVKNAEQTAVQIGSIVSREFGKVGRDIADALSNAFSKAFEQTSELAELDIEILKKQNEELKYAMQDSTKSQVQQLQAKKQLMENEAKILEKSQSNMSKLQSAMLVTVADFLESLGKGLIAAGLAVETFQKSLASNPLLAVAAGVAAVAAAAFVRSKINKGVAFADGGIVSGPTLGLVGEYPGASTNPEVIAPLDKLKNIIGGGMGQDGGYIAETRVSGRDLALVLSRYEKDRSRG